MTGKKSTRKKLPITDEAVAKMAREFAATADWDPRWTAIKKAYSLPELLEYLPKRVVKRALDEILLEAIAQRKAQNRGYIDLRFRFGRTIRQMTDFVHRNRLELARRTKALKS
ncbi:MAG: hypothetical protein WA735_07115 [Candidatus Acidiferrales bacterium]